MNASKKYNERRIEFQGRNINFKENPRTNVCSKCGKKYPDKLKEQTSMHHQEYDPKNPLANTVELCRSCHLSHHHGGENSPMWQGENASANAKYVRTWRNRTTITSKCPYCSHEGNDFSFNRMVVCPNCGKRWYP